MRLGENAPVQYEDAKLLEIIWAVLLSFPQTLVLRDGCIGA